MDDVFVFSAVVISLTVYYLLHRANAARWRDPKRTRLFFVGLAIQLAHFVVAVLIGRGWL